MTLTQAIQVASRVMLEHAGIEIEVVDMRPRAVPVNPDNPEQIEAAQAYNALAGIALLMREKISERENAHSGPQERNSGRTRGAL